MTKPASPPATPATPATPANPVTLANPTLSTPSGTPRPQRKSSRRRFLGQGAVASASSAVALSAIPAVHAQTESASELELVRIGLVGCGGRGGGAIENSLSINENVKLVAMADLNPAIASLVRNRMTQKFADKVAVDDDRMHTGLDGYKRILDADDVDVVLFATPPGFRPFHVRDAVEAGKHVFAEKPSCVDPAGYRICLEAHRRAEESGTAIVTGTQYRRQANYIEAMRQIHDGVIGDVIAAQTRYCSRSIWFKNRRPGMTDTEYQVYNWMHFIWLSGDQIAEQAVHNVDVMNWLMGGPPLNAFGGGGRFTRPEGSEMWDSMAIDYEYPGGKIVSFMCRQIPDTKTDVGSVIHGSKGTATILGSDSGATIVNRTGEQIWSMEGDISAAYEQEHKDLVDSIRAGKPIVELKQTADSSMAAVLGRMAAYTGQKVDWEFATEESTLELFPEQLDMAAPRSSPGYAIPGKTPLV